MQTRPVRLRIYRTTIPMRSFEHAAASRSLSEAVVARLELSDGSTGWGETLPREYVTGESMKSVFADLSDFLWPALLDRWAARGGDPASLDAVDHLLPAERNKRCINAARCCLELAVLGAAGSDELAVVRSRPIAPRVTGVLGSVDPARTRKRLRLMRWIGLRDFKLKLGLGAEADAANLLAVTRALGRSLAAGRCTLRVDVNGGWDVGETPGRVAELKARGVVAVEQPVYAPARELADLAGRCSLPLIADESLLTPADADALAEQADHVWWNLRISKNGGLVRTLRLAELAARRGAAVVLGCMVGETGLLSAAQRRLLQLDAGPRFVEGNYGRFLLGGDLTVPSPRFGYGGRLRPLRGPGLGVRVDERKLARHAELVADLRA